MCDQNVLRRIGERGNCLGCQNLQTLAFYTALIKSLSDIYRAVVTALNVEIST